MLNMLSVTTLVELKWCFNMILVTLSSIFNMLYNGVVLERDGFLEFKGKNKTKITETFMIYSLFFR